jgi:hypothetical protein
MIFYPKFLRVALLLAPLVLGACAKAPTIRGVLNDRYPGYDRIPDWQSERAV